MVNQNKNPSVLNIILTFCAIFACASIIFLMSVSMHKDALQNVPTEPTAPVQAENQEILHTFDRIVDEALAQAYDAAASVPKAYWIDEATFPAPKPAPDCYGDTKDPATLDWLLEDATELLNGQETLFHTNLELAPNSKVTYYLDKSILVDHL